MSVALLDVSVLIAIFDTAHPHHDAAHLWFGRNRKFGWSTCPMTLNGCIRIVTNPVYITVKATPGEVIGRLRAFCSAVDHQFWEDSISLTDNTIFLPSIITSHQKITDAYLLGLAVRNHGRFVTFDRSIPMKSVIGAEPRHLVVLGHDS